MDTLFRKENYLEYIRLLNEAKTEFSNDLNYKGAKLKVNQILDELKEETENASLYMLILIIPIVLFALLTLIKYGLTYRLIIVALVVIYFLFYRSNMKNVLSAVTPLQLDEGLENTKGALINKIQYVKQGIEVKKKRYSLVKGFYVSFFPLLMVLVAEYVLGPYSLKAFLISLVAAFVVGGFFWSKFFSGSIKDLSYTHDELLEVQNELTLAA